MVDIDNESRFMITTSENNFAIDLTKFGEGLQRIFEITLLMGYSQNGIVCIDEIDSAVHKSLLIRFTEFIQKLAVSLMFKFFYQLTVKNVLMLL